MKQVWKYQLEVRGRSQKLQIPVGATLLHAAQQTHDTISLWFEIVTTGDEEDGPTEEARWFQVYGTGHSIPEPLTWIATTPGLYVWHIYEDKNRIHTVSGR